MPPFVPRKRLHTPPAGSKTPAKAVNGSAKPNKNGVAKAKPRAKRSVEENRAYLERLQEEDLKDGESSSSGMDSDDFEEVLPEPAAKRRKIEQSVDAGGEDSEEEMDWEDAIEHGNQEPAISGDLQLTLDSVPTHSIGSLTNSLGSKKGPSKIERAIRYNTHAMHVQCLMYHNLIRNGWICDKEVQEVLVGGLTAGMKLEVEKWKESLKGKEDPPRTEDKSKAKSTRKEKKQGKKDREHRDWGKAAEAIQDEAQGLNRSDPTLRLLKTLCAYWNKKFNVNAPGLRKQGWKDAARLEAEMKSLRSDPHDPDEHGEIVTGKADMRRLAKQREGSRDIGAQLFTALLRGIGIESRMVASLQPIGFGWSKIEEALPAKSKKTKPTANSAATKGKSLASNAEKSTGSTQTPASRRPKTGAGGNKDSPIDVSDDSELTTPPDSDDDSIIDITPPTPTTSIRRFDRDLPVPIYWTEALLPLSNRWIPVDPLVLNVVAHKDDDLERFEPRGARAEKGKQVLAYVVAFSSDGTAKDVTTRYLKRHMWPGKTKGMRIPVEKVPIYNRRGKVKRHTEYDWFGHVMRIYQQSSHKRSIADDIEDAKDLKPVRVTKQGGAAGEDKETLQGYKTSADFVLERFLRREEAILPGAQQAKTFKTGKGDAVKEEAVFYRKDIVSCKTVESWHKEGRAIKAGEQPLKFVPMRAVTTIRKREIEEAERESGEKQKQGLYAKHQTHWIIPPPIKDGVIPKNSFGNMDVYVPTMVPKGAIHVPLRGTAKICRRLGIDYAEACTGFEFGNRRAVPILTGVVVAKENEDLLIDAWEADEEQKAQKEADKNQKLALGMWKKMLAGLRVIERVKKQYGDEAPSHFDEALMTLASKGRKSGKKSAKERTEDSDVMKDASTRLEGGFIVDDGNIGGGGAEAAGGGFMLDDAAKDKVEHPAGDFFVDGDEPSSEVVDTRTKPATPIDYLRTPVSLHGVGEKNGSTTPTDVDKTPGGQAKRKSARTKDKIKPRKNKTTSESEREIDLGREEPTSKRKSGRRAARKSAEAVRSHYFEQSSDEED